MSTHTDGFNIGWDQGVYKLVPRDSVPPEVREGYLAAGNRKTKAKRANRYIRKWLQLRLGAYERGKEFSDALKPTFIREITPKRCPVLGIRLTFGTGHGTDWSVDRLDNDLGYLPGNVVVMSTRANKAKGSKTLDQIKDIARSGTGRDGLTNEQWKRLDQVASPARLLTSKVGEGGIQLITGTEIIAPGVPLGPLACLQYSLAVDLKETGVHAINTIYGNIALPSGRACVRALNVLFKQLGKRRRRYFHEPLKIWTSPRVMRAFLECLQKADSGTISITAAKLGVLAIGLGEPRPKRE